MSVSTVVLNVADVTRSVDFYTTHLQAQVVGEVTERGAVLDVVTATVELVGIGSGTPDSTFLADDLQLGFRHVGFKVDHVDPFVERLRAAGVAVQLEPIEAEGGVRITFFRDPDGTLLELVERDLQYAQVLDEELLAAERALGVPDRPRFDHVAVTVADLDATKAHYAPLGFVPLGTIEQPHDQRGFGICYLKSGDTVLELFTFTAPTTHRSPQLDAPGFVAAVLTGPHPDAGPDAGDTSIVGVWAGHTVLADRDGFTTGRAG